MLNIDVLTIGNVFKDDNGNEWKIVSNFSDKKIYVELEKAEAVEPLELIPEK